MEEEDIARLKLEKCALLVTLSKGGRTRAEGYFQGLSAADLKEAGLSAGDCMRAGFYMSECRQASTRACRRV